MSTEAERKTLGDYLRGVREAFPMSFAEVEKATDAQVSESYLKRLEAGMVQLPAPHVLYALAGAYIVSYEKLMTLAGHIRPAPPETTERR
jgi:transcriptional regulator with XRE-family HTH domain